MTAILDGFGLDHQQSRLPDLLSGEGARLDRGRGR
jgi:hypothetical protein